MTSVLNAAAMISEFCVDSCTLADLSCDISLVCTSLDSQRPTKDRMVGRRFHVMLPRNRRRTVAYLFLCLPSFALQSWGFGASDRTDTHCCRICGICECECEVTVGRNSSDLTCVRKKPGGFVDSEAMTVRWKRPFPSTSTSRYRTGSTLIMGIRTPSRNFQHGRLATYIPQFYLLGYCRRRTSASRT